MLGRIWYCSDRGGTGRRAGLRILWGNPWGFESLRSHRDGPPTQRATHPRVARCPSTQAVAAYRCLSLVSIAIRLRLRLSHALLPHAAVLLQARGPIFINRTQSLRVLPPQHAEQAGLSKHERRELWTQ